MRLYDDLTKSGSSKRIAIILAVAAMLPGVLTAIIMVQDGADQISDYISVSRANNLHSQLSKAPGGLAWDYLQGGEYSTIKVEWASFDRHTLDNRNAPFSSFESLIFTHCNKSSISYTFVGTIPTSLHLQVYTEDDLNRICDVTFKNTSSNDVAIVHMIFLAGSFSDPSAVGISFTADRIALFGDTLGDTYLQVAIAHEMGHLLGLVAPLGLNSPYTPSNATAHYDSADPPHCITNPCLMRPVVSSNDQICRFCDADLREIANSSAPYAISIYHPTVRYGLIMTGLTLTAILAISSAILIRKGKQE